VGASITSEADVHLRERLLKYASRGGYKLEAALTRFQVPVAGRVCLDAGASTGGFVDCLLQCDARKVFAVEVGYGQLRGKLANDERVVSLERTNISDVQSDTLGDEISLAAADLSYLSLTVAIPILRNLVIDDFDIITLIKPLYEGFPQDSPFEPTLLKVTLERLFLNLAERGFTPTAVCVSPLFGGRGAIEFLARFTPAPGMNVEQAAEVAIADLIANPPHDLGDFLDSRASTWMR
jgi:23S rRNA (cytidine1920-2'-O)/16S rRNA (cytidine1409-2'-O)-methyltransferase